MNYVMCCPVVFMHVCRCLVSNSYMWHLLVAISRPSCAFLAVLFHVSHAQRLLDAASRLITFSSQAASEEAFLFRHGIVRMISLLNEFALAEFCHRRRPHRREARVQARGAECRRLRRAEPRCAGAHRPGVGVYLSWLQCFIVLCILPGLAGVPARFPCALSRCRATACAGYGGVAIHPLVHVIDLLSHFLRCEEGHERQPLAFLGRHER